MPWRRVASRASGKRNGRFTSQIFDGSVPGSPDPGRNRRGLVDGRWRFHQDCEPSSTASLAD